MICFIDEVRGECLTRVLAVVLLDDSERVHKVFFPVTLLDDR